MKWIRPNIAQLLGVVLLLCALAVLWMGCKGNSSPSPSNQPSVTTLPVLHAQPVSTDPLAADPLTSPLWHKALWTPLSLPLNDTRTAPPTRVAVTYDPQHLYVAFICFSSDPTLAPRAPERDTAEVWLDTSASQDGTEFFSITVTPAGKFSPTWYRTSMPPQPKEDGSPNYTHPINRLPDYPVKDLRVKTAAATLDGQPVWTAVFAIPLKTLPIPLQTVAKPGAKWRANLLRTAILQSDSQREILQSNFAPVQPGAQPVAPYRMAELILDPATPPLPTVALRPN